MTTSTTETPDSLPWRQRIESLSRDVLQLRRRQRHTEVARLLVFIGLLAGLAHVLPMPQRGWWPLALAGGALVFALLVVRHHRLGDALHHLRTLIVLNEEGLARIARDFSALAPCPPHVACHFTDQDRDLNLHGPASLGQLLFNLSTSLGDTRLAQWLSRGAAVAELAPHQQAVRELAPQLALRQRLYAHARSPDHRGGHRLEQFQAWAGDNAPEPERAAPSWLGWLLTLAGLGCLALVAARLAPVWLAAAALALNLGFLAWWGRGLRRQFERVDLHEQALTSVSRIVAIIGAGDYRAGALREIAGVLGQAGQGAPGPAPELSSSPEPSPTASPATAPGHPARALRQLAAIVHHSRLRFNLLPYLLAQSLLLWDFHVAMLLRRWRRRHAGEVAGWLDAIARFEALSALANLSHENPGWCFAQWEGEGALQAQQAVHPLMAPRQAVANDIGLQPGQVSIITGSNMSGKTTYMRTLGLNLKLAMAGGPAACAGLRMPPCELHTAFSSSDSLQQGLSYFMSEVVQIRRLLAGVQDSALQPVFLLDELLKGTNERERNMAIVAILQRLCAGRAMGMMTTHSLTLATDAGLRALSRSIYFEEDIDESSPGSMRFSYRLRSGVSTQTNAIKLLRLLGVEVVH